MSALQKVTTEYVEAEDRIRLAGEIGPKHTVVIWLSLRLLQRLLPHLLQWLEQESVGSVVATQAAMPWHEQAWQGFAQQAAQAQLPKQAPVVATQAQATWLVHSIELAATPEQIQLIFKGAQDSEQASLGLVTQALRQWLGILYSVWQQAQWPLHIWPQWMQESLTPSAASTHSGLLH